MEPAAPQPPAPGNKRRECTTGAEPAPGFAHRSCRTIQHQNQPAQRFPPGMSRHPQGLLSPQHCPGLWVQAPPYRLCQGDTAPERRVTSAILGHMPTGPHSTLQLPRALLEPWSNNGETEARKGNVTSLIVAPGNGPQQLPALCSGPWLASFPRACRRGAGWCPLCSGGWGAGGILHHVGAQAAPQRLPG